VKVLVLTVSDRASTGVYEDRSGPAIVAVLAEACPGAIVERVVVPDEKAVIAAAFETHADCDCILTTGGTGLSPRDVTPEATMEYCDRMAPGIAEMLRSESLKETPHAALSRGMAGMKGSCLIVNLPGSVRGATFCAKIVAGMLPHALAMIKGEGH
jgi:molybdopterin adenylyltransferase